MNTEGMNSGPGRCLIPHHVGAYPSVITPVKSERAESMTGIQKQFL